MRNADCELRNFLKIRLRVDDCDFRFRNPNSAIRNYIRVLLILCMMLFTGCGYQMVGKQTHVPPGMNSIAIPTFLNKTLEPGIEIQLTQGFLREFILDRRAKVVDRKEADVILEGVIRSFLLFSVAYNQSGIALEYQVTLVADLTLKRQNGEVIWKELNLSETRYYQTSPTPLISESNKGVAVQQIGSIMAERILNRVFSNF